MLIRTPHQTAVTPVSIVMFLMMIVMSIYSPAYGQEDADSTDQFKASINAYPYAYYTPETQLAFGAGGVLTYFTQKDHELNPSKLILSGFYSTIKTYEISLLSNMYFNKNRMASTVDLLFAHTVDRFYGIGNNTPELGTEEYVLDNVGGIADFQLPPAIVISDRAGLIIEYRDYKIGDRRDNPYLQSDSITGSTGGAVSGIGMVYVWDNRDQVFFPNNGGITEVKVIFYTKDLGSDFTFHWLEVNSRRYWAFKEDHVIAAQVYFNSVGGNIPFYKYPALGGSKIMRGYFKGRYRDTEYLAIQLEYRQYFWWKFGFAVFMGSGDVAPSITAFQLRHLKPTYGAGLRFLFNEEQKINLRVDFGFGKDTSGIYFSMEEAF